MTCECVEHPAGARFYVSVVDAGRVGLLAGPYVEHGAALDAVAASRVIAERRDPWSHFYAFGTVAMPATVERAGLFNDLLGDLAPKAAV